MTRQHGTHAVLDQGLNNRIVKYLQNVRVRVRYYTPPSSA